LGNVFSEPEVIYHGLKPQTAKNFNPIHPSAPYINTEKLNITISNPDEEILNGG